MDEQHIFRLEGTAYLPSLLFSPITSHIMTPSRNFQFPLLALKKQKQKKSNLHCILIHGTQHSFFIGHNSSWYTSERKAELDSVFTPII